MYFDIEEMKETLYIFYPNHISELNFFFFFLAVLGGSCQWVLYELIKSSSLSLAKSWYWRLWYPQKIDALGFIWGYRRRTSGDEIESKWGDFEPGQSYKL